MITQKGLKTQKFHDAKKNLFYVLMLNIKKRMIFNYN